MKNALNKTTRNKYSQRFTHVREAHQNEVAEDYVEMIDDLINDTGEARTVDLATSFGVTSATVNKTVQRLQRDGLVVSEPYRSIFLTEQGKSLANECRERHDIVMSFLLAIGVSAETAELDSEGIEHHVSAETLTKLKAITKDFNK